MLHCCVPGCDSSFPNSYGVSFHEIPANFEQRAKWVELISRKNWTPSDTSNYSRVCSLHFLASDFKNTSKKRCLLPKAVPSVFPSSTARSLNGGGGSNHSTKLRTMPTNCVLPLTSSLSTAVACPSRLRIQTSVKVRDTVELQTYDTESLHVVDHRDLLSRGNDGGIMHKAIQVDNFRNEKNAKSQRWKNGYARVLKKLSDAEEQLSNCRAELLLHQENEGKDMEEYKAVLRSAIDGDESAVFLVDQVRNFYKRRPSWSESTIRNCTAWRETSRDGYRYVLKNQLFKLPSRSTVNRFMDNVEIAALDVSHLVTQHLDEDTQFANKQKIDDLLLSNDELIMEDC